MAKPKVRRTKSDSPGVVVYKAKLGEGGRAYRWRAKWMDPETGRWKFRDLAKEGCSNAEKRKAWAKDRVRKIEKKKAELEEERKAAQEAADQTELKMAVKVYLREREGELRAKTVTGYRQSAALLLEWARVEGVEVVEDLDPALLGNLRVFVRDRPHRHAAQGGRRGELEAGDRPRKPPTINRDLRALRTLLTEWRRQGRLPQLDSDAIADRLRGVKDLRPVLTHLRSSDLRKLVAAAMRHDAVTWKMTRKEKEEGREPGSTPRFPPITPFLLTTLLTGARFSEVLGLTWSEVDLEADAIVLDAARVKTGQGRRIDLAVSPSLRGVLAELKLRARESERVFAEHTSGTVNASRRRLMKHFGAPPFSWQELRRTCGTFLTCAPGIYGAASAFLSAKRLGHSVLIAEKHYVGALGGLPGAAQTLEGVMGIETVAMTPDATEDARSGASRLQPATDQPRAS
jgi:integrase